MKLGIILFTLALIISTFGIEAHSDKKNYYEILGVSSDATPIDLKRSYRQLAMALHPDRNPNNPLKEEQFKAASEAYEILSDPEKRLLYDEGRDTEFSSIKKSSVVPPNIQALNVLMNLGPMPTAYYEHLWGIFDTYRSKMSFPQAMLATLREFRKTHPIRKRAKGWSAVGPSRYNYAVGDFIEANLDSLFYKGPSSEITPERLLELKKTPSSTAVARYDANRFVIPTFEESLELLELTGENVFLLEKAIKSVQKKEELNFLLRQRLNLDKSYYEFLFGGTYGDGKLSETAKTFKNYDEILKPAMDRFYPGQNLSALFSDYLMSFKWHEASEMKRHKGWIENILTGSGNADDVALETPPSPKLLQWCNRLLGGRIIF